MVSPPMPAVRMRTGQRFCLICGEVGDAGVGFGGDQDVAGVLDVGDEAEVGAGGFSGVGAGAAVGVAQELDGDGAEVDWRRGPGALRGARISGTAGSGLVGRAAVRASLTMRGASAPLQL